MIRWENRPQPCVLLASHSAAHLVATVEVPAKERGGRRYQTLPRQRLGGYTA